MGPTPETGLTFSKFMELVFSPSGATITVCLTVLIVLLVVARLYKSRDIALSLGDAKVEVKTIEATSLPVSLLSSAKLEQVSSEQITDTLSGKTFVAADESGL